MASRLATTKTFARAARRYWLSVFPDFRYELRRWQTHAHSIANPALRELALDAQHSKQRSLEGAVAFAAFVPRSAQRPVITALAAYQIIFDYLDTLAEQPNSDPISNGRQLNEALLTALEPRCIHFDYYALHEHRSDSGYLDTLIETCRVALASLPSYSTMLVPARRAAVRCVAYQTLNHGDAHHSHAAFARWAREETRPATGLRWWETGAAAGSSLAVLALISAMADPCATPQQAEAIDSAYYPWMGALHTLLDSLIDQQEDTSSQGQRSLISYYRSPAETAARLGMIAEHAVQGVKTLHSAENHALILAAMASFYLSDPQASTPATHAARNRVLATIGGLTTPTMIVMHARRSAKPDLGRPAARRDRAG